MFELKSIKLNRTTKLYKTFKSNKLVGIVTIKNQNLCGLYLKI